MSSSGSQHRLSRVLFREDRDTDDLSHDEDENESDFVSGTAVAESTSELDDMLLGGGGGGGGGNGICIISDSDGTDNCDHHRLSSSGHHANHMVDEPSSPFKLTPMTLGPDMTSSPTYIRSVRDLKILNSPPQTPKTLPLTCCLTTTSHRRSFGGGGGSSSGTTPAASGGGMSLLRTSTGAASCRRIRSRTAGGGGLSSGRGTKRSYLTPLVANVNPFSPSSAATAAAGLIHSMHRTSSSSCSSSAAGSGSCEHKRVRLAAAVPVTQTPSSVITGQRLNFSSLTPPSTTTTTTTTTEQQQNCSSDSGHVLLNSTDEMTSGGGHSGSELSAGMDYGMEDKEMDNPFCENWSSESDAADHPLIADRSDMAVGGGDGLTGSRYVDEFLELDVIGKGTFGTVFQCQHKLDGLVYAVKVSSEPIRGSAKEKRALNEVYAHAVLGKHHRVVHYYSAWVQDERMYIQNEYCEGGSLNAFLDECRNEDGGGGRPVPESLVRRILLHVAQGLKYIHSQNLAHMDIKPENIFLTKVIDKADLDQDQKPAAAGLDDSATLLPDCATIEDDDNGQEQEDDDDEEEEDEDNDDDDDDDDGYNEEEEADQSAGDQAGNVQRQRKQRMASFKIGDLGLVTHSQAAKQVYEGDCRYLARELLYEDVEKDLTKSDVYALGMTIVEVMRGSPLPKNDEDWHRIRDDPTGQVVMQLQQQRHYSPALCHLVRCMISAEAGDRPSAAAIVHKLDKTKSQLRRELNSSMARIEELNRQLNGSGSGGGQE